MESFEMIGYWWIPGISEKQIPGRLSFKPKQGGILELFGSFFENFKDIVNNKSFEIIHGITKGKILTLYKCYNIGSSISIPGFPSQNFYVKYIIDGELLEKDLKFDYIHVFYPYLLDWMSMSLDKDVKYNSIGNIEDLRINFEKNKKTKTLEISDREVEITFNISPSFSIGKRNVNLNLSSYIMIRSRKNKKLEYYLEEILPPLENFLTLGMNNPVYPERIYGFIKSNDSNENSLRKVNIYYKVLLENSLKYDFLRSLFHYRDVEGNLEYYMSNWFEQNKQLKPVFDLYFATVYNPSRYMFHNFLNLIIAIEGYHKKVFGEGYLEKEEYDKIIKPELLKAIDSVFENNESLNKNGFKESIKSKVNYLYEYSLRRRLKDIVKEYSVIKNVILKEDDWRSWIEDAVEFRNQGVHVKKLFSNEGLNKIGKLTGKLKQILQVCLLKEMGMNDEKIKKLFERRINF